MRRMIAAGEQQYRRSVPRALVLVGDFKQRGANRLRGLFRPSVSFRKCRAEHGEAALRFGLRRLVLHDVPMFCETSVHDTEDVDDDPGRPPTPTEAPVHHDVVATGDCERAFVPPRDTPYQT